ncbi:Ribosomal L11 methyltransferase [Macleaya cordata]|uniref:ETFB lysine methyltransferase n=1 Tax=Macleaya cordata TaxID=56857 RepID=A0A200PQ76_MACCD|nr:Ribosomal L11 methyltransferase [Macleaya cordata]
MLCSSSSLRNPFFKHLTSSLSLLRPLILPHHTLFSHLSAIPQINHRVKENRIFARFLSGSGISTSSSNISSLDNWTNDVSTSPYFSVRLRCPKDVADMLSEALLCFGASSASMDEPESSEGTDEICINSIFTECQTVDTCISHAADSIGLKEVPTYEVIMDEECDWVKKSQESFHPVEVTEGLWIVPEWRTPPDLQATNIILNPGLAFGTGDHPTTKLCLLLLHDLVKGGESFLDYGTGSGILGIAAVKLGAALSVGLDIDPEAITRARQNAALNHIGTHKMQLRLVPSEDMPPHTDGRTCKDAEHQKATGERLIAETENYDIVIANILLNPLIELADDIVAYAKPGAVVAVTGIIVEQLPQIEDCYSQYLEGISVSKMDGWACVSGRKKRDPRCN